MSKKRNKSKKSQPDSSAPLLTRRRLIGLPIAAAIIGTTAFGLSAREASNHELHDLSVIGQGEPVIVQIHDPGCPTCRRLKSVVQNSMKSQESVKHRLADITTTEGSALQKEYNVPHVTLLYFDAKGKHVHTTTGMQTKKNIEAEISRLF